MRGTPAAPAFRGGILARIDRILDDARPRVMRDHSPHGFRHDGVSVKSRQNYDISCIYKVVNM
jgi:hypothetical protein